MNHLTPRARSLAALTLVLASLLGLPLMISRVMPISPALTVEKRQALRVIWSYVGRDLKEANKRELSPLLAALRNLDEERESFFRERARYLQNDKLTFEDSEMAVGPYPRYVWAFGQVGRPHGFLVLDADTTSGHPGYTGIRLTVSDRNGVVQGRAEFTTGWRCYLRVAELTSMAGVQNPVIVLQTVGRGTAHRQFYAHIGDRFELVRLEGEEGVASRNQYWLSHWLSGPCPPQQSAEQWEADLNSRDRVKVLNALVWLGGRHLLPLAPGQVYERGMEDPIQAEMVRRVRGLSGVAARLRELAEGDTWEREAALLALTPEDW